MENLQEESLDTYIAKEVVRLKTLASEEYDKFCDFFLENTLIPGKPKPVVKARASSPTYIVVDDVSATTYRQGIDPYEF